MRSNIFYTMTVLGIASLTVPASAQFHNSVYIAPYNPGLQLLNDSIRGDVDGDDEEEPEDQKQRPVVKPAPRTAANLVYTPSKAQTQRNLANFVAKTRETSPANADQMAQIFASTDIIGQIAQGIRPLGLRVDNVADSYTVWWIAAWYAANGQDGEPDRALVMAVKRQAESALKAAPEMAAATNDQKQEIAEAMLIQAGMIDAGIDDAKRDPAKQAALATAVNQGAKAMGLDLTTMTLTPNGFVPRSGGRSDAGDVSGDGSQLAASEEGGSNLALYAVAGTGLLAGVFALGKGLAKKG